jgi:uncharacterized membrane protein
MSDQPRRGPDERMEQVIGNLLRVGVVTAALVVAAGGALFLLRHGAEPAPDRRVFVPLPPELARSDKIVEGVLQGSGRALIQFGLLLLIATPVVRVGFSALAFARQGDRTYVAITLVVLAVLLYGLFSGQIH